jgi:hypothetical protein
MRNFLTLVFLGIAGYFGYQLLHKPYAALVAEVTPCGRISKFMDAQLPAVLGPMVHRDAMGKFWAQKMPVTELMQLRTTLKTEAASAAREDGPRYQAALAVCDALEGVMKEQQAAFVKYEASVQGLTQYGASWEQITERHNARWNERSAQLVGGVTKAYAQASQVETASLGAK